MGKKIFAAFAGLLFLILLSSLLPVGQGHAVPAYQEAARLTTNAVAYDGQYVYLAGSVDGLGGQLPSGALDLRGGQQDIWFVKLDLNGQPVFQAVIGGGDDDAAYGLAVHQGVVYVLGETWSDDFPSAPGNAGENDAVLLAIAADGSRILWARRFGGGDQDSGRALIFHENTLFMTGITWSEDFVAGSAKGDGDGFLGEVGLGGGLVWMEVFGGSDLDAPYDLTVANGALWVAGQTFSSDFAGSLLGGGDGFAARFSLTGQQQLQETYGGQADDLIFAVAPRSGGGLYLAGGTNSANIAGAGAFSGNFDAIFYQTDGDGNTESVQYLGGEGPDYAQVLIPLANRSVLVVGWTESPVFPADGPVSDNSNGNVDSFIAQIDPQGALASVRLEGREEDDLAKDAVIASTGIWLAGEFDLNTPAYAFFVPLSGLNVPTIPTTSEPLPTATLANTATLQPTETPRPTATITPTPSITPTRTNTLRNEPTRTSTAAGELEATLETPSEEAGGGASTETAETAASAAGTEISQLPSDETTTPDSSELQGPSATSEGSAAEINQGIEGQEIETESGFSIWWTIGLGLFVLFGSGGIYLWLKNRASQPGNNP